MEVKEDVKSVPKAALSNLAPGSVFSSESVPNRYLMRVKIPEAGNGAAVLRQLPAVCIRTGNIYWFGGSELVTPKLATVHVKDID